MEKWIKFNKVDANLFYQTDEKIARLSSKIKGQKKDTSQGDKVRMAICLKCNYADTQHEIKSPSKRYELKNGKKLEVCSGFSVIPENFFDLMKQMKQVIPQKVIAS